MINSQSQSFKSSSSWTNFIASLEKENKIVPIQWNHNRELIMLDDRKKSQIFLKEIFHYDCDDPLKMIDSSYHQDKYNINLFVSELNSINTILTDNSFDLIIERQEKLEIIRKLIDHYLHFIVDQNFTSIIYELKKLHKTEALIYESIAQSQLIKGKMNQIKNQYLVVSIKVAMKKQKMKNLLKMKEFTNNYLIKWRMELKEATILKKQKYQAQLFNKLGNIKYNISTWATSNPITIKRNLLITDVLLSKIKSKMGKVQIDFNKSLKSLFMDKNNHIEEIYELFITLKTVQFQNPYEDFITNLLMTFKLSILSIMNDCLIQQMSPSLNTENDNEKANLKKFSALKNLSLSESQLLSNLPLLLKSLLIIAECYNVYMIDNININSNSINSDEKHLTIRKILYDKRELFYIVFQSKLEKVLKYIFSASKDKHQSSKSNFLLMISYISLFSECLKTLFSIPNSIIIKQFIIELIKDNIQNEVRLSIRKTANILFGDNWKRLALRDNDEIFTLTKYEINVSYRACLSILKDKDSSAVTCQEAMKTFMKLIENPTKYAKGRIEIDILSKPMSNLKIIHSSSSYSLIKSILDLIANSILYEALSRDVFKQIFNLFDYYILATLNMRMVNKSYLIQIFQTINIDEIKKKNNLPSSSQFSNFLLAHSSLRKHFNNMKKNLGELFNIDIDPLANNYNDETKPFFLPKLNNQILVNENNFYSLLIESIVLVESIISVCKFIIRLDRFITDEGELEIFKAAMKEYKLVITQLRSFLYKPICSSIFNFDAILGKMLNQKWEIKESEAPDFSNASPYIDQLLDELFEKYDKLNLLSGGSITSQAQLRFFDILISYVIERLIDSVSQIKKCNSTGRSLLLKDIKIFKAKIDENILQINNKKTNYDKYFNKLILYINSWYYTEDELKAFVKETKIEFKYSLIILFSGTNFEFLSKIERKEAVERLENVYYEIIDNINKELNSNEMN